MAEPNAYIEGILQRDGNTIRQIYEECYPRIEQFILKNNGTASDAQDVFQEAIMVVYANAQKSGFVLTSAFYTYLHAICRNLWLRQLKRKRQLRVTFSADWEYMDRAELETNLLESERFELFWKRFKALGADCQRLLRLFFEGASMKIIMEKMGFGSEGYARKRKYQCKQKLHELIVNDPEYTDLSDGQL
ncbi:MAG: RNA polymerase sigma factor [Salibacteraceae bacterium]